MAVIGTTFCARRTTAHKQTAGRAVGLCLSVESVARTPLSHQSPVSKQSCGPGTVPGAPVAAGKRHREISAPGSWYSGSRKGEANCQQDQCVRLYAGPGRPSGLGAVPQGLGWPVGLPVGLPVRAHTWAAGSGTDERHLIDVSLCRGCFSPSPSQ